MRMVDVLRWRDFLLLEPMSRTVHGVWIGDGKTRPIAVTADDHDVGCLLDEAMGDSRDGVPHPDQEDWKRIARRLPSAAGARSWKALVDKGTMVSVRRDGRLTRIVPMVTRDSETGFFEDLSQIRQIGESIDPSQMGAILRAMLIGSTE